MNTLKRLTFLCLLLCTAALAAVAQDAASWAKLEKSVNFYIAMTSDATATTTRSPSPN